MEFKVLMKSLADEVGMSDGFVADEDGVVRIGSDKGESIAFAEVDEMRAALIWSRVGELPQQGAEAVKEELLKANFMGRALGGATLSLSDDGSIYLHRMLPLVLTAGDAFIGEVTSFVDHLQTWRRLLKGCEAVEKRKSEKAEEHPPAFAVKV